MRTAARPAAWLVSMSLAAGLLAGPPAAGQEATDGAPAGPATAELDLSRQRAERVAQLDGLSRNQVTPFVASPAADDPTIVLTQRPTPWTIAEVRALFPAAFSVAAPPRCSSARACSSPGGPGSRSAGGRCAGCGC